MINAVQPGALVTRLFPNSSLARDAMLVLGGSLFIALLAQVSVPLQPVPITGQTLGVFLVALALGMRLGGLAIAAYLLEGAVGLPVFASGAAGIATFVGPTGGYLVGFLFAGVVVGMLADRGWTRNPLLVAFAMIIGTVCIYVPGLAWIYQFPFAKENTLNVGLYPFIVGDAVKAVIAAGLLPSAWTIIGKK